MKKRLLAILLVAPFMKAMVNQDELNALLIAAIKDGEIEQVQEMLDQGAEVNARCDQIITGLTSLKCAARYGATAIAQLLLQQGAFVNGPSDKVLGSSSALHYACEYGHEEMVKLLLDNEADINAPNWFRQPPLSSAAARGHFSLVKFLIEHGALVNPETRDGSTQCSCGQYKFDITGDSSPLSSAIQLYREDMAQFLIEQGAKVNQVDGKSRKFLLELAYGLGDNRMVQLLKKAGATLPDQKEIPEVKPGLLLKAAQMGFLCQVKALILAGMDLEEVDEKNQATPFMWAANNGHTEACKLLLEAGANPKAQNEDGKSALDCARKKKHTETAVAIEEFLKNPLPLKQLCVSMVRKWYKQGFLPEEQVVDLYGNKYEFDRVIVRNSSD